MYVTEVLAEALEEVKSVEPDAIGGRTRVETHRSGRRFGHLVVEVPGLLGDEAGNSAVLRHGADKVLLTPVPEQVVGAHRRPPARVTLIVRYWTGCDGNMTIFMPRPNRPCVRRSWNRKGPPELHRVFRERERRPDPRPPP